MDLFCPIPLLYMFFPQVSAEETPGKVMLELEVFKKPLFETRASSGIVRVLLLDPSSQRVIIGDSMRKAA